MSIRKIIPIIAAGIILAGAVPLSPAAVPTIQAAERSEAALFTDLDGTPSSNISRNNYSIYSSIVNSYLYESGNGQLTRVEYIDGAVVIENYMEGRLTGAARIAPELPIFGGFFCGCDANYLVFGQNNPGESDNIEVIRVVKYTKDWVRLDQTSVFGANTVEPFSGGSLRMTEAGNKLYVYTCHKMYNIDGLNHQANMTLVINKNDMSVIDSFIEAPNNAGGCVGYSLNQFICTDGEKVFRADHGGKQPRSMYVSRCDAGSRVSNVSFSSFLTFARSEDNTVTGASLGGMTLTDSRCVIAGNSVDQSVKDPDLSGQRNIFVSSFEKDHLNKKNLYFITNYPEGSGVTVRTPVIARAGGDRLILMWEERSEDMMIRTRAVALDGDGAVIGSPVEINARLSDCQPIMCSDGYMRWYCSDGIGLRMYAVDPYDLRSAAPESAVILGDITGDGAVDSSDASAALAEYAAISTGEKSTLTAEQFAAGDVDKSGAVDSTDASLMLSFYAYTSTGGAVSDMEKWLAAEKE